eukprot:scaffold11076_cov100-Isochrysis_galbana.AAC.5
MPPTALAEPPRSATRPRPNPRRAGVRAGSPSSHAPPFHSVRYLASSRDRRRSSRMSPRSCSVLHRLSLHSMMTRVSRRTVRRGSYRANESSRPPSSFPSTKSWIGAQGVSEAEQQGGWCPVTHALPLASTSAVCARAPRAGGVNEFGRRVGV